jgi:large subunit ribosomal protein L31
MGEAYPKLGDSRVTPRRATGPGSIIGIIVIAMYLLMFKLLQLVQKRGGEAGMPDAPHSLRTVSRKEMHGRSDRCAPPRCRRVVAALRKENRVRGTHPDLVATHVRCSACGNEFTTRSVRDVLVLDVCANCHPAYTGVERPIVQGGRIERFERRRGLATAA